METSLKKYAIIVAAGSGTRMNSSLPKQFLLLKKKPVLFYSIDCFLKAYDDLEIILVLPQLHISKGQEIIDAWFDNSRIRICEGGATRFHSVQNGLALIETESIIFVHDAARCLLTQSLVKRSYKAAVEFGTAIPGIPVKDSVRYITDEGNEVLDRNKVMLIQTPQVFHSKILLPAYKIDYKEKLTDEASVVDAFGLKVRMIEGEVNNIKITTVADILFAETIIG
ncbi:MAG: 2-C-methyl-D-erythritol 4-phosphate cytidylyltransferase [Chitinophagaceae bacterium]|nr:2-C-methyl-D-erythritol 4-phosphate cytidylyltransferase [Chitinophagaceae bacterium]